MPTERPRERRGRTHHFTIMGEGTLDGYLTLNVGDDGEPLEVFIVVSKHGGTLRGLVDTIAVLISTSLQAGVPVRTIVEHLMDMSYEPGGLTTDHEIPDAKSLSDYVARRMAFEFLQPHELGELGLKTIAKVSAAPAL